MPQREMNVDQCSRQFLLIQCRRPGDPVLREERASFARALDAPLERVSTINLVSNTPRGEHLDGISAILVGGAGEFSVCDPVPAVACAMEFLAAQAEAGFPIFASCFGFQMLAASLGGSVVRDEPRAQVGTYTVRLTDQGREDPLFGFLPPAFTVQEGHTDRADTLPSAAICLATSPDCPFQAFRLNGLPVYATQFHPELDEESNRQRFARYLPIYIRNVGEHRVRKMLEGFAPSPLADRLLRRFVRLVLENPAGES